MLLMYFLLSIRYGFVSFEKEDDVKFVLNQGTIFFWGKKINVGPAVKKKVNSSYLLCRIKEL